MRLLVLFSTFITCVQLLQAQEVKFENSRYRDIVLISGSVVQGTILEETGTHIVVSLADGSRLTIPLADIKMIRPLSQKQGSGNKKIKTRWAMKSKRKTENSNQKPGSPADSANAQRKEFLPDGGPKRYRGNLLPSIHLPRLVRVPDTLSDTGGLVAESKPDSMANSRLVSTVSNDTTSISSNYLTISPLVSFSFFYKSTRFFSEGSYNESAHLFQATNPVTGFLRCGFIVNKTPTSSGSVAISVKGNAITGVITKLQYIVSEKYARFLIRYGGGPGYGYAGNSTEGMAFGLQFDAVYS